MEINGIIQSSTNGNFIIYGAYVPENKTPETDSRGFIIIVDQNMKPIKAIYEFSSGTLLRPIQKMIQIEDGTFVAVDCTIYTYPIANVLSNQKRFIMLNNFTIPDYNNEYSVVLRKSYTFPNGYSKIYCLDIFKNPNSAHYLIAGKTDNIINNIKYDGVRVIDLKINVGSSNEWSQKYTPTNVYYIYGGINASFDSEDNASFKAIVTRNLGASGITLHSWDGTSFTLIMDQNNDITPYVDSLAMRNQVSFIDYDNVYFVINNQRWGQSVVPRYVGLYKYTYSTGKLKEIFIKYIGDFNNSTSREGIFINSLNGELYVNYCDNYDYDNKTANYNYQRLENDMWQPILIAENKPYYMEYSLNYNFNIYNVVTNIVLSQMMTQQYFYFQIIKEIYNNLNYNGTSYVDYDTLIPHTSVLYDNNNKIIFGRNLYNSTSFKNTTTSTVEVPNTMLNNIGIQNKNLYGLTNVMLDQDNNMINKNIYETLFLNFINTINVINEDTGNTYLSSGTYITTNINNPLNDITLMNNTKIGNLRINYEDGTNKVVGIGLIRNDDTHYTITSTFLADSEVDTIDIISKDTNEIYITLNGSNLEAGKTYTLEESLRIE